MKNNNVKKEKNMTYNLIFGQNFYTVILLKLIIVLSILLLVLVNTVDFNLIDNNKWVAMKYMFNSLFLYNFYLWAFVLGFGITFIFLKLRNWYRGY